MKPNYLILVFLTFFQLFVACTSSGGADSIEAGRKNWEKFVSMHPQHTILDVRSNGEVAEGIIQGASVFIDYNNPDFDKQIATLDKGKIYVVYCRSGNRSAKAASIMKKNGFNHVFNLEGGISEWDGQISTR